MKKPSLLFAIGALTACSAPQPSAEQICLSRIVHAAMNADKVSNPDMTEGAIAIAKAEATVLRSVSTKGCTDKQRAEITAMANERQVLVDLGQRLTDIRSGKIKIISKDQELARAENMVAATGSYQLRFDSLVERLGILSGSPEH